MSNGVVSLGDIVVDARAGFASGEHVDDGIVQLRMNNITTEGQFDWSKVRRVPRPKRLDELTINRGDILFNATNSPELVGKNAVFDGFVEPVTFSNHFIRLRLDGRKADSRLVSRWLTVQWQRGTFKAMCRQWVNQASLNKDQLLGLEIALPPLVEQRRIAAILDQADDLRRKRREALNGLGRLRRSILDQLLARKDAPQVPLGQLVSEFRYGTSVKASGVGRPVLRIPNVVGDVISLEDLKFVDLPAAEAARLTLKEGDLLFVRTNGNRNYVGRSALVRANMGSHIGFATSDFVYASYLIRARLKADLVDPVYLQNYLTGPQGRQALLERAKTSAGQFNIAIDGLGDVPVALPPMSEQRSFGEFCREIDSQVSVFEAHLTKLYALFAALQHRAFRREL